MSCNAHILRLAVFPVVLAAFGCAHTAIIDSDPPGAELYVNGEQVGITPFNLIDTPGSGDRYEIVIRKPGYRIVQATLHQDQFNWPRGIASVGCGLCTFGLGCLGLLTWSWQLQDRYAFVLESMPAQAPSSPAPPPDSTAPDAPSTPPEEGEDAADDADRVVPL